MKTYTLEVLEPANEGLVADILTALQKQRLIDFAEAPADGNPALLGLDEVTEDVLLARQQPSVSLQEARARFGL